jgi:peptidoglycan/LPS O-acetylase OafA/YrhL
MDIAGPSQPARDALPRTGSRDGYRDDIDGLRAVAVAAVVFFHARVAGFNGGFVGVDVFFVISGFLITTIILREVQRGTFSIAHFYERRVRRIFPALMTVMATTLVVGFWLMLPSDFQELSRATRASTWFLANLFFLTKSGYFDAPPDSSPLLHTWSLSVEEQFYLLYPALFVLIVRYAGSKLRLAVLIGALLSLALSLWGTNRLPLAAFYLAPFRMWELLSGAILALRLLPPASARLNELMAMGGLAVILTSIVFISETDPFPGIRAVAPCLGTVWIIYAGLDGPTRVSRLLSRKPIVFVGLISYSLYLWHWPILVFLKYIYSNDLPWIGTACGLLLALAFSVLSWRFVEVPFRDRRRLSRRTIFVTAAASMVLITAVSTTVVRLKGLPQRFDPQTLQIVGAADDSSEETRECLNRSPEDVFRKQLCQSGVRTDADPSFLVWGDSHAAALMPAFDAAASENGVSGLFAGQPGCPPLVGVTRPDEGEYYRCREFNDAVMNLVSSTPSLQTIILAARWSISTDGTRYKGEYGKPVFIVDDDSATHGIEENKATFSRGLRRTLTALRDANKSVVVVGPIPEVGRFVPRVLALRHAIAGIEPSLAPTYSEFRERQSYVIPTLEAFSKEFGFRLVYPHQVLCTSVACRVEDDGFPLYSDDDHLTATAARSLEFLFRDVFITATGPVLLSP